MSKKNSLLKNPGLALCLLFVFPACVTPSFNNEESALTGSRSQTTGSESSSFERDQTGGRQPLPAAEELYQSYLKPETKISKVELLSLRERLDEKPSTLLEAVLGIGLIRWQMNMLDLRSAVYEEEMSSEPQPLSLGAQEAAPSAGLTSSFLALNFEFDYDLTHALQTNPFLSNHFVHEWLREIHSREPLPREVFRLLSLPAAAQHDEETVELAHREASHDSEDLLAEPLYYGPEERRGDDESLVEASELAAKSQYQEAIELLRQVPQSDPRFSEVQEQIESMSRKAMGELRKLAAKEYKNAGLAVDPQIKAQYLNQAKSILETAISRYPDSEQVDTARQNIQMIQKILDDTYRQLER